jgi:hypothetical protein
MSTTSTKEFFSAERKVLADLGAAMGLGVLAPVTC